ncbi:MAG: hypothetical protein Ct9H300mP28_07160 [Pseudomonadota bacterium]|nr:MAG: hypothetical protein Ct9H300mP28_07160 [Pseudomonadota bacterium]
MKLTSDIHVVEGDITVSIYPAGWTVTFISSTVVQSLRSLIQVAESTKTLTQSCQTYVMMVWILRTSERFL